MYMCAHVCVCVGVCGCLVIKLLVPLEDGIENFRCFLALEKKNDSVPRMLRKWISNFENIEIRKSEGKNAGNRNSAMSLFARLRSLWFFNCERAHLQSVLQPLPFPLKKDERNRFFENPQKSVYIRLKFIKKTRGKTMCASFWGNNAEFQMRKKSAM